jgi:hypothetical protein
MILEITGLERGTMESKQGKVLPGLRLDGIKIDREGNAGEQYSKFLMDWKNADEIAILEQAGIAATVNLVNEKDGNFWNLVDVKVIDEGTGQSSTPSTKVPAAQTSAQTVSEAPQVAGAMTVEYQAPKVSDASVEALRAAVELTDAMLSSDERFKKLLPATKTTVEIVTQMTLENAAKFKAFIKGSNEGEDVNSDGSDLNNAGVDADEPVLPGDED